MASIWFMRMFYNPSNKRTIVELTLGKRQRIAFHRWGILLVLQDRNHLIDAAHLSVQRVHELLQVWNDLGTWIQPMSFRSEYGWPWVYGVRIDLWARVLLFTCLESI